MWNVLPSFLIESLVPVVGTEGANPLAISLADDRCVWIYGLQHPTQDGAYRTAEFMTYFKGHWRPVRTMARKLRIWMESEDIGIVESTRSEQDCLAS
jgi:hypothetical protein